MSAKLGIKMIEKYEQMVREDFSGLFNQLEDRERKIEDEIEVIVKKELGIYDLYVQKAKKQLELDELEAQIDKWEKHKWNEPSRLQKAIDAKMKVVMNGERDRLEEARTESLRNVRLMAIDADMRDCLRDVTKVVKELKEEWKAILGGANVDTT